MQHCGTVGMDKVNFKKANFVDLGVGLNQEQENGQYVSHWKSDSTKLVKTIVSVDAWIKDLNLCEVCLNLTKKPVLRKYWCGAWRWCLTCQATVDKQWALGQSGA